MRKLKTIEHNSNYTHYKDFVLCEEITIINEKTFNDSNELCSELLHNHKVYFTVQSHNQDIIDHYDYLKYLGDDHFIFGEEFFFNKPFPQTEYGVLKLVRDAKGNIIPGREEILFWGYNKIEKSNEPGILIADKGNLGTYLNIDKESEYYGKQLLPSSLEEIGKFIGEFAKVKVKNTGEEGFFSRNAKPVKETSDIKLLTEKQMKCLINFQKGLVQAPLSLEFVDADRTYKEITCHSYIMREK